MERNAVAAFLLMLRNFLQGHAVNQESLVQCQGPAIIGALLRKVASAGACEEGPALSDPGDWVGRPRKGTGCRQSGRGSWERWHLNGALEGQARFG